MQRLLIGVVVVFSASCVAPAASSADVASPSVDREVPELSGGEIIRARCIRCHHQGGTVFSLESTADVATHRETMGHVVAEGFMPAWLPSDSCVALAGGRRLARKEREVLVKWLATEQELPPGKPWPEPEPYNAQLTLQAQLEFPAAAVSRRATMTEDIRCFAMGTTRVSAMTAMRVKPDSVPGLEMAEVFAVPATHKEQKADCPSDAWPVAGKFLGVLTRVSPEL